MSNLSPFIGPTFTTTNTSMIRNPSWSLKMPPPLQQPLHQQNIRLDLSENEEHISRHLDKVNNENVKLSVENIDDDEDINHIKSVNEEKIIKLMTKNSIQESQSSLLAATNDELKVFHGDEEEPHQQLAPISTTSNVCFTAATIPGRPPFLPVRPNTSVPLFTTATLGGLTSSRPPASNLVFSSANVTKIHSAIDTPAFTRSSSLNSLNSCLADDDIKSIQSSVASEYSQCMGHGNKYKKSTINMERVNESDDQEDEDDYQDKSQNPGDLSKLTNYAPTEIFNSSFMKSTREKLKQQQENCREKAMEGVVHLSRAVTSSNTTTTLNPSVTQPLPPPQFKFQQINMNLSHSPATRDTFNPTNASFAFLNSTNIQGTGAPPIPPFILAKQSQTAASIPSPFVQQFKFNTPPQPSFQFNSQPVIDDSSYEDNDVLRVYPQPRPKQITNLISLHASPPESVCSHMSDLSIPSVINQEITRAKESDLQDLYQKLNLSRPVLVATQNPVCQNLSTTFNQMETDKRPIAVQQRNQNVIDSMSNSSSTSKTASSSSTPSTTNWARNQPTIESSDEEDEEETEAFINKYFVPNSPASPSSALNNTVANTGYKINTIDSQDQDIKSSKRNLKRTSLQNVAPLSKQQFGGPKRHPSFSSSRSSMSSVSTISKTSNKLTQSESSSSVKSMKGLNITKAPISSISKPVQSKLATGSQTSQSNPAPVINMTKTAQLRAAAVTNKQTATTKSSTFKTSSIGSPVKSLTKSGGINNTSTLSQRRKSLIIGTSTGNTSTLSSQRLLSTTMRPAATVKQTTNKISQNQIKLNK